MNTQTLKLRTSVILALISAFQGIPPLYIAQIGIWQVRYDGNHTVEWLRANQLIVHTLASIFSMLTAFIVARFALPSLEQFPFLRAEWNTTGRPASSVGKSIRALVAFEVIVASMIVAVTVTTFQILLPVYFPDGGQVFVGMVVSFVIPATSLAGIFPLLIVKRLCKSCFV